jgi:hypothetical protein
MEKDGHWNSGRLSMIEKAQSIDESVILEYCRQEPEINIFIIGDILNFGFDQSFQEVYMVSDQGGLYAVILRYYRNYIVYTQDESHGLEEVADFINLQKPEVLSAKQEIVDRLIPNLTSPHTRSDMLFSRLKDSSKLQEETSEVQKAHVEDARIIAEAMGEIHEFKVLYADILEERVRQIENRIISGEGVHLFIRRKAEIIAHANSTAETTDSGIIGGVFTKPSVRRQGYAKKVVSTLCAEMLSRGKTPCLFYNNEEAGALYNMLGFQLSGYWTVLGGTEDE